MNFNLLTSFYHLIVVFSTLTIFNITPQVDSLLVNVTIVESRTMEAVPLESCPVSWFSLESNLTDSFLYSSPSTEVDLFIGTLSFSFFCGQYSGLTTTPVFNTTTDLFLFANQTTSEGVCGDGVCEGGETGSSCAEDCCCGGGRECGLPEGCFSLCGLCPFETFCTNQGTCSIDYAPIYVKETEQDCASVPPGAPCFAGPYALRNATAAVLSPGSEVLVGVGVYCGEIRIEQEGVKLTGTEGAKIVPCSPVWWEPGPPACQQDGDGEQNGLQPCLLGNSLVEILADSVVVQGLEFDGRVPNELFDGSTGVYNFNSDGSGVGAARGLTNVIVGQNGNRTRTSKLVMTLTIKNNTFLYLEDAALDFVQTTIRIERNVISKIGTVGANTIEQNKKREREKVMEGKVKRQGASEQARGERKKGRKGTGVSLEEAAGEIVNNVIETCSYAGMDHTSFDPSVFPFRKKKRSTSSTRSTRTTRSTRSTRQGDGGEEGLQYNIENLHWGNNEIGEMLFGGLIIEDMTSEGTRTVQGNQLQGESPRGFILENLRPQGAGNVFLSDNRVDGSSQAVWLWNSNDNVLLEKENYVRNQISVHLVNCNPYEGDSPVASSTSLSLVEANIWFTDTALLAEDEPTSHTLCKSNGIPVTGKLNLKADKGWINDTRVALETIGKNIDATGVWIYTERVETKILAVDNKDGEEIDQQDLPPDCPETCNGHGVCDGINICECENGYSGLDCSYEVCGDSFCTENETDRTCPTDCFPSNTKITRITMKFKDLIPKPSCCSQYPQK